MPDFDALRATATTLLTGGVFDDPARAAPVRRLGRRATSLLAGMAPGGLWDDLPPEGGPGNVTGCHQRLRLVTTAWATPGTVQHADDAVLLLAQGAPEAYRRRFRELAKGWIERCSARPYLAHADVPATRRAVDVLGDPGVAAAPGPVGHFVFPDMDRVVHRRPGWSYAIGMSSRRVAAYEAINGENPHGWYTGDGMTYLYTGDPGQFGHDFWPTVDPYRLPGTTVDTRERADLHMVARRPDNAWAGGATLAGRYGAASMEVIGDGVPTRARKSWFCLDAAVVALGSGIRGSGGHTVETVLENRATEAEPFLADGWAHLEGTGGYVFEGTPLSLTERRTGRWHDINSGDDTGGALEPVSRRYVTIWYDHGIDPADAAYAYVLLPGASRERTRAFHRDRPVAVLANTPLVQAVRAGGLWAATFWAAGTAGVLTADAPCVALVRRRGTRIDVAVADPGRTVEAVTLTLGLPAHGVLRADDTVTVTPGARPRVTVKLGGSAGRTHAAALSGPGSPRYGR
ncbi:polysaccharide lyase family 8 super-sandwich domain-containing protein [Nonomuraea sp. WAC 01424]|uniref:polysaccharide lyase family 8 super-sandwich domain-containing protein n=1 Tax=Nonomuraea sp. WAC 01424 TaxID=2203200 RepID=UPI001C8CA24F|nr:polysaccharide lyase family 8 super-sandwich domain-containing protein [Nonomuraea sp. WAC 01424]